MKGTNNRNGYYDQHSKVNYISCLLIQGFANKIIEFETGFSLKRISKIRSLLTNNDHEYLRHVNQTINIKLSSSKSLIASTEDQIRASVLMSIYNRIHEDCKVYIDCTRLAMSFGIYLKVINSEKFFRENNKIISVNEAWSLAQELRSQEACFIKCNVCSLKYFESIHQKRNYSKGNYCPWCSLASRKKDSKKLRHHAH